MANEQAVDAIIERILSEERNLSEYFESEVFEAEFEVAATAVADMIKALGCMRDSRAAGAIIDVLRVVRNKRGKYGEHIREEGLKALGKIGGDQAISSIISYFRYDELHRVVQDRAIAAIKQIGSPAIGALAAALGSDDPIVQKNALRALGEIGDKDAIAHIVPLVKNDNIEVAGSAALLPGRSSTEPSNPRTGP